MAITSEQLARNQEAARIDYLADRAQDIDNHSGNQDSPNLIYSRRMESVMLQGQLASDDNLIVEEYCKLMAELYASGKSPQIKLAESVMAQFGGVLSDVDGA